MKRKLTVLFLCVVMMFCSIMYTEVPAYALTSSKAEKQLKKLGFYDVIMEQIPPYFSVTDWVSDFDNTHSIAGYYKAKNGKITKIYLDLGGYKEIYPKYVSYGDYGLTSPQNYLVESVSGNTLKYRVIKSTVTDETGSLKTAKLTSSTVYLRGNKTQYDKLSAYFSTPHWSKNDFTTAMNKVPYLKKNTKSNFSSYVKKNDYCRCGIKIKNGKVKAICYDADLYD